jgi:hypothetical protein
MLQRATRVVEAADPCALYAVHDPQTRILLVLVGGLAEHDHGAPFVAFAAVAPRTA